MTVASITQTTLQSSSIRCDDPFLASTANKLVISTGLSAIPWRFLQWTTPIGLFQYSIRDQPSGLLFSLLKHIAPVNRSWLCFLSLFGYVSSIIILSQSTTIGLQRYFIVCEVVVSSILLSSNGLKKAKRALDLHMSL